MKKNFFKKLSFILALAMIVSVLAPAAGVFAKAAPKLNSASVCLYLDQDGKNVFDFNIANKQTGWKYLWTSANKKVATVNKSNGLVTATGAGKTTVSVVISDKKGNEKAELTASVLVRDNIKTLTITNVPTDNKLAVGATNDFNRTYVTAAKLTKGSQAVTRWVVTDKDGKAVKGATINDSGVFTATVAGVYTVTANAFQSSAKYTEWLSDSTKYAKNVTATTSVTITVPNAIKTVAAVKSTQLKVTFASPAAAVDAANFLVVNTASTAKQWIKSVTLSDDKTYALVNVYNSFVSGQAYTLSAKVDGTDMKGEVNFVKGTPTKIVASTSQVAKSGVLYKIAYTVLDENGLDITDDTSVSYESSGTVNASGQIMLNPGQLEYVYVVYTFPATAAQLKSDKIAVTGIEATGTDLTSYTLSTNHTSDSVDFSTIKTAVDKNDPNTYYLRFKYVNQYSTTEQIAPWTDYTASGPIKFTSLDPQIVVVDERSGRVTPVSAGTGSVRIEYGNINVVRSITVRNDANKASVAANKNVFSVSRTGNVGLSDGAAGMINTATLHVNFKNNYSETMYGAGTNDLMVHVLDGNSKITLDGTLLNTSSTDFAIDSDTDVVIAAAASTTSNSTVALKIYDATDSSRYTTVSIAVNKADQIATGYGIDGVKTIDIQNAYDGKSDTNDYATTLKVYTTNAAGFKITEMTQAAIEVKGPNSTSYKLTTAGTAGYGLDLTDTVNVRNDDFAFNTGEYTVAGFVNGVEVTKVPFTVKDTGVKPAIALINNDVDGSMSTSNFGDQLSNLDTYTVVGFKFTAADASRVSVSTPDAAGFSTTATFSGDTTLYNVKVKVSKVVTDDLGGTATRYYTIDLMNMDATN